MMDFISLPKAPKLPRVAKQGQGGKQTAAKKRKKLPPSAEELRLEALLFGQSVKSTAFGHEAELVSAKQKKRGKAQRGADDDAEEDGGSNAVFAPLGLGALRPTEPVVNTDILLDDLQPENPLHVHHDDDAADSGAAHAEVKQAAADEDEEGEDDGARGKAGGNKALKRRAAWVDDDDDNVTVDISNVRRLRKLRRTDQEAVISGKEYTARLRDKFAQMNAAAARWAEEKRGSKGEGSDSDDDDKEEEEQFLRSTHTVLAHRDGKLPQSTIQLTRMKDANIQEYSNAVIQRVQFHPTGHLLFSAGLDKTIRLFQIDGVRNPKVQSVHLPDCPIHSAEFVNNGTEIVASGRRSFFFSYDLKEGKVVKIPYIKGRQEKSLESFTASPDSKFLAFMGKGGVTILVSNTTKQWIANLKMSNNVRTAAFSPDSQLLYTLSDNGQVYTWDVASRRCMRVQADDGCVQGTALAVSSRVGEYWAAGQNSGIVNIYSATDTAATPRPLKTVMNLTRAVHEIRFNHDSQLMAISSRAAKDTLKLVHLPSFTTFGNWPTSKTPLGFVNAMAFSPESGYFAVGNDKGKVLLWRLNYYRHA